MPTAPQEASPEDLIRAREVAENAAANPEQFKEDVKAMTETQLNALAEILATEKKALLSEAVKAEIRTRLNTLDDETPEETMDMLLARIPAVRSVLESRPPTNTDRLKADMETAQSAVTSRIGTAYEYVKASVITPIIERTKDMFLIGPLLGSLGELSPTQIKNSVTRKWYQFLSTAEFFGGADGKGFFAKTLFNIADGARQHLALLDIRDVIEDHKAENRPGETITLDEKLSREQWKKMKDMLSRDPAAITSKVATLIDQRRTAGITDIKIVCADLLKTDAEAQDQAKIERLAQLKTKIIGNEAWKNAGVTTVNDFSADETSLNGGVLTVAEADLDATGAAKPNTRAAALIEARKVLLTPEKIVIAKDLKDVVTVNWNAPRSVTLPLKTGVDLGKVNEVAGSPQPDRFSILEIGASDAIANDEVQLMTRNGSNVLVAENNPAVLDAIAEGNPTIDTAEASPKYKYASGTFTLMPAPMPVRPPAA